MKVLTTKVALGISITLLSSLAYSSTDKDIKRYSKCYSMFVRQVLPNDNPLLLQIKQNQISGVDACMKLVNKAHLNESSGEISKINGEYDQEGKAVLKSFNDFHRGWFSQYSLKNLICTAGNSDVHDANESAYFLTKSLFSQTPFSSIVTSNTSLKSVRLNTTPRSNRLITSTSQIRKLIKGNRLNTNVDRNERFDPIQVQLVETGELVGITEQDNITVSGLYQNSTNKVNQDETEIFKNFGAGIISGASYFMMNSGRDVKFKVDGGMNLHRRWTQSVVKDLLCRDLPAVRALDALPYVDKTGESSLPFRAGISCMQCHSTMDQMARGVRNLSTERSANSCNSDEGHGFNYISEFNTTMSPHEAEKSSWIDQPDSDYRLRPAEGKFYYRNTKGELINKDFEGLAELGRVLSETDDLYTCAAKRYVKYLTGTDVPMFDPGDTDAPEINSAEKAHIKFINNLGKELKSTGDMQKLIKSIVASKIFLDPAGVPQE